jgi:hypothetical protein
VKRLVTSDWQLADGERDRYRLDMLEHYMKPLISKYQPDQFIFLGDLTEAKDNHPASLVNEIVEFFDEVGKCCEVIFLQGNHDFLHKANPFFKFLQGIGAVEWIDTPTVKDNCLYLPHTRDYKKDWKGVHLEGYDFIFAHNIFTGVMANGRKLSGIPTDIFPNSAFVISGDVHEPQSFGVVTYVGSPVLCDFGDHYQPRVLLLDGTKVKSIKVHGRQKRLINCSVDRYCGARELNYDLDANANDIVKIQVHMEMEDVAQWAEIRTEVEQWAVKNNFVVNTIQPIVAYVQGERQQIVDSGKKSDAEYVDAFVKRNGADDRTARIGREIIETA